MTNGNKGETRIEEPTRAQRTIARRAAESRATIPHLELSDDVALAPGLPGSERSLIAVVTRATALALREVPRANGSYRDGRFELHSRVNVGVMLPTDDGFVVPTVFDADGKTAEQLTSEIAELARRAQSGELLAPELSGATFTVALLGAARGVPPVIPPQAGALGAGTIRELPVVRDTAIVPAQMLTITLACDHRILYGSTASGFLSAIGLRLEDGRL